MELVFWHDPRHKIYSAIEEFGVSNSEERMNVNIRDANHTGLFGIQSINHYKYIPPKK